MQEDNLGFFPEEWRYISQAENQIAGCLLVDGENTIRLIRGIVDAADFQSAEARNIFLATINLIDAGKACDPVLIQEEAAKRGTPLDNSLCSELMRLYTTTANAAETARIVHEAAINRTGREVGTSLMSGKLTPLEAVAELQTILTRERSNILSPIEAAEAFMDYILDVSAGKKKPFLSTGFSTLDRQLAGGLVQSGMIVLAARPGVGKTTAALNIADNVAAAGGTVLYLSLEMDSRQLWTRRTANLSGLSYTKIYEGKIQENGEEMTRLVEAVNCLSKRSFVIRDKPSTIEDIEREARCTEGLTLLVVDHIGLIRQSAGKRIYNRYELMTDISHQLKALALSLHIPILALCQLNRSTEEKSKWHKSKSNRPEKSELRDTGAIEEDADVVCLLYREAQNLPDEQKPKPWEKQCLEVIVDKNRHGMTGVVKLDFWGINARIRERPALSNSKSDNTLPF